MAKRCDCGCGVELTGKQRRYASDLCRARQHAREKRAVERQIRDDPSSIRRGSAYKLIASYGLYDLWTEGQLSSHGVKAELEERTGQTFALNTVSAALNSHRIDRRITSLDDSWEMDPAVRDMLCLDPWPDRDEDPEGFEAWLDQGVESFVEFERHFFRMARGPYIRKAFHRRWIRGILRALAGGGKVNILSPPRHGKTELLLHFVVWLICRDPEIRILWVSLNDDIAGDPVMAVKEVLEEDENLIRAVLPPSQSFAPMKRGSRSWSATKLTVNCRQIKGNKAPTLLGVGKGAGLLSKDVDLIISDDIEDHRSTEGETGRKSTRKWFGTQLGSRWEEHTAWVNIGSRQHPDDLHGYLLDDEEWDSYVEHAHDPQCEGGWDPDYGHVDCMLFPEVRTFRWLSKLRNSFTAQKQEHLFYMVYQNDPQPEGFTFWTREFCEKAYDPSRGLGIPKLPEGRSPHLVAGLDPSAVRHQAAFVWAIDLDPTLMQAVEYLVDIDNGVGGGVDPFLKVGQRMLDDYGVRHWVIEITMYRTGFLNDPRVIEWVAANNIIIEPTDTQGNMKHDPWFGIGAMRRMYGLNDGDPVTVNLPTGTPEARAATELYVSQMLRFTDDLAALKKRTTDVLMASWFPQKVVRRWVSEWIARIEDAARPAEEESYSGFGMTEWDNQPW